uniref:Putative reverse transcriptase domain-containing protein n=1 Tax=Tanacetum cinerariifolium TaxID=118510 RepID=A0A6L2M8Q9_TANCI|nr:putative reverse transcriptase domain-containing protein [Tanacetum cinerariifolium]
MSFLSTFVTSRFLSTNNQLRNSSNPRQKATIHNGRVTVQPLQWRSNSYVVGTSGPRVNTSGTGGRTSANPGIPDSPVTQTIITNNAAYQADDLDTYDFDCDDITTAKVARMANFSRYGSDVLSKVPHSEHTSNDMLNQTVQDRSSSAQQDAMILSVFEQLSHQEKELLTTTFNVLKNESKEKEVNNIDKEIAWEKKVKELDNIVYKMGQSAQTVHMLTKPQVFCDNNLKQALGFQNPFYLKKAQQVRPMLYDGNVIAKETNMISVADSEETLILEEESRSKMLLKQNDPKVLENKINIKLVNYAFLNQHSEDFGKHFVPQEELSVEQAFWFQMSNPSIESSDPSLVKADVPGKLHKVSLMNESLKRLKFHLAKFDSVVKTRITPFALTKGIYKLDSVTLAPKDKNNREIHIHYLKHTMEQAGILREKAEQDKSLNPSNRASYTACKYVKQIQELLGYVKDTCPDVHKPSGKLVAVTPINIRKTVRFAEPIASSSSNQKTQDSNKPLLHSTGVKCSTSASGSKPSGNAKNNKISQPSSSNKINKVEDQPRSVKSRKNKNNRVCHTLKRGLDEIRVRRHGIIQYLKVHSTFHVSNLKKCLADEPLAIPLDEIQVDDKLHFIEEHVEIMDHEVRRLKQSRIPIDKVRWEREDQMQKNITLLTITGGLDMALNLNDLLSCLMEDLWASELTISNFSPLDR